MPTRDKKRISSLAKYLVDKARQDKGALSDSPVTAVDMLQAMVFSGLDYKGQVSTGRVAHGRGGGVTVGIDFADFVVPGLGSLGLQAGGGVGIIYNSLIIAQRQPQYDDQNNLISNMPCCLAQMSGKLRQATVSAKAVASLGKTFEREVDLHKVTEDSPETLTLAATAKVELAATVDYTGRQMELQADQIEWFSVALGMSSSFASYGAPEPALDWLERNYGSTSLSSDIQTLSSKREKLKAWSREKRAKAREVKDKLKGKLKAFTKSPSSEIEQLQQALRKAEKIEQDPVKREHIQAFLHQLENPDESCGWRPANLETLKPLCKVSLWGHDVEGQATATAQVAAGPGSATGEAGAQGAIKHTLYRLQMIAPFKDSRPPLLITQDTVIDYRQATLTAGVLAKIPGYERSANKLHVYNMMTYRSAVAFWYAGGNQCQQGSGLCYGVSVGTERLAACTAAAKKYSDVATLYASARAEASILICLAEALRCRPKSLFRYLKDSWFDDGLDPKQYPTMLLETSFAAPPNHPLTTDAVNNTQSVAANLLDDWDRDKDKKGFHLQSLRVRFRIADEVDSSKTFKLGAPLPVVKLGIELKSVDQVGREGVVDLDTCWSQDWSEHHGGADTDPRAAYESAVPPVVLLHQ